MRARRALVLLCAVGCAPVSGGAAALPGSGGGALGTPPADTGTSGFVWRGYDAAVVHVDGEPVCDAVWDTVGEAAELPCEGCAFAVTLSATRRLDVGSGDGCPAATYDNAYAWRPVSNDEAQPAGLLAHQPGGWVWIGQGAWQDEVFVGQGSFTDGARQTAFTIVGRLQAD